ncbi:MAG TPA: hypothetical protein VHB21_04030, partial [Minicystis sp.]|nr:hypothetical protein [Minicystis sp.]
STRVAELAAELGQREDVALDARERLELEAVVRAVAGEMAGVVRVVDLLGAAVAPRSTALELADLLRDARAKGGGPSAPVTVVVDLGGAPTLVGDAHLVLDVLFFALAALVHAGVARPSLRARAEADGRLGIDIGPAPEQLPEGAEKRVLELPSRTPLPRECEVLAAAARRAGFDVDCDLPARRIKLRV